MILRATLLAMLALPLAAFAAPAGYVLAVEGEWRVEGAPLRLAVGAEVPPGALLRVTPPTARSAITIVARGTGRILFAKTCAAPEDCEAPLAVPHAESPREIDGLLVALIEKTAARLRGNPTRYVATITRSESTLADSVLALVDGRLLVAPAMAAARPGPYQLALRPLACAASSPCATLVLDGPYEWDPTAASPIAAPGLTPGLYELEVAASTSDAMQRPAHAWVRVSPPSRHARNAASFAAARRLASGWDSAARPDARQAFLRGALEALDD